jgi:hypothetical protein
MTPDTAAVALLKSLKLPEGAANVLTWHETAAPTLRIWVEERYYWHVKRTTPQEFEGFHVDIEVRPTATAHKTVAALTNLLTYSLPAMTTPALRCAEPSPEDEGFLAQSMNDDEFENYVRVSNSDIPITEVEFFSPAFADE